MKQKSRPQIVQNEETDFGIAKGVSCKKDLSVIPFVVYSALLFALLFLLLQVLSL